MFLWLLSMSHRINKHSPLPVAMGVECSLLLVGHNDFQANHSSTLQDKQAVDRSKFWYSFCYFKFETLGFWLIKAGVSVSVWLIVTPALIGRKLVLERVGEQTRAFVHQPNAATKSIATGSVHREVQ